jgi:hypothetical protein
MGLDASVGCNCLRDGKTKLLPFPLDWFELHHDGSLSLNLKREHESNENVIRLTAWHESCCEHKWMKFASERFPNWAWYYQFRDALCDICCQDFPVLKEQLPDCNEGLTFPSESAKALVELEAFESIGEIGTKTVIADTATGEVLHERLGAYQGIFIFSRHSRVNVGLSEFEFFAVDATTGHDLFRATRVRQFTKSGLRLPEDGEDVVWEDLDTGRVYESGIAIHGKRIPWEDGSWETADGRCRFHCPSDFHIEQRPRFVGDFDDIVRSLRTVFDASVKTGNPVCWS